MILISSVIKRLKTLNLSGFVYILLATIGLAFITTPASYAVGSIVASARPQQSDTPIISAPKPASTTLTVTPIGASSPLTLSSSSSVKLTSPATFQEIVKHPTSPVTGVSYYLGSKLLTTVTTSPYSYAFNTKAILSGSYSFVAKTYYLNGKTSSVKENLVIANSYSWTQFHLALDRSIAVIIIVLLVILLAVLYMIRSKLSFLLLTGPPRVAANDRVLASSDNIATASTTKTQKSKAQQIVPIVVIVIGISILGHQLLSDSHAATPYGSVEAISGALTGGALKSSDGASVVFGKEGTTTTTGGSSTTGTAGAELPDAPSSLGAPSKLVFDDEFNTGSLNTKNWAPYWFSNGAAQNDGTFSSSNVSVDSNGLELNLNGSSGGLVSSNPNGGASTGFQITPNSGGSVYVEWEATIPGGNGQTYNWPGLWLTGQSWPQTGEIDMMEGFGDFEYHIEYGPPGSSFGSGVSNPGGSDGSWTTGQHTFGLLWTTSGVTFLLDGNVVGNINEPSASNSVGSLSGPMYLIMENGPGNNASPGSTTMTVRYVRVWQGAN
jgi:hypothetical protein